jgi:hypothetical protein
MKKQLKRWVAGFFMVAVGLAVIVTFGYHLPKWFRWYSDWAWPDREDKT